MKVTRKLLFIECKRANYAAIAQVLCNCGDERPLCNSLTNLPPGTIRIWATKEPQSSLDLAIDRTLQFSAETRSTMATVPFKRQQLQKLYFIVTVIIN